MNIFKRITRVISNMIFYFLLALIVLLLVYALVITIYKKQNKLGEIPLNFYTILTTSMHPEIKAGDIVITYKNKNDMYNENDVITFISESNITKGVTITHRIIKKEVINGKYYYYTKGDANNTADRNPVSSNNVIGKVVFKIPKAGYLQQFLISKFGWLVLVVLPCLSIIIYDIVKIIEKIFKLKKGQDLLNKENTKKQRDNLNRTIDEQIISNDFQEKIDLLCEKNNYSTNKITNIVETQLDNKELNKLQDNEEVNDVEFL